MHEKHQYSNKLLNILDINNNCIHLKSHKKFLNINEINQQLSNLTFKCNTEEYDSNFLSFIKVVIDQIFLRDLDDLESLRLKSYHNLSKYAFKLLNLMLFVNNYEFCIRKILAILISFIEVDEENQDKFNSSGSKEFFLEEFICIILLLLLKLSNDLDDDCEKKKKKILFDSLKKVKIFKVLKKCNFLLEISNFISFYIKTTENKTFLYTILKLSFEIYLEYFKFSQVLKSDEFFFLVGKTDLLNNIVTNILNNKTVNGYNFIEKNLFNLVTYEQVKLLFLLNEQNLLLPSQKKTVFKKIFFELIIYQINNCNNKSNFSWFFSLLVYYMNREQSIIVKILFLKYLHLVFIDPETMILIYLNDLKILVDIFIRDLNDLYYNNVNDDENISLLLIYLIVFYFLLLKSQLGDYDEGYKNKEIIQILKSFIISLQNNGNILVNKKDDIVTSTTHLKELIFFLSLECLSINWLKKFDETDTTFFNKLQQDLTDLNSIANKKSINHFKNNFLFSDKNICTFYNRMKINDFLDFMLNDTLFTSYNIFNNK